MICVADITSSYQMQPTAMDIIILELTMTLVRDMGPHSKQAALAMAVI